MNVEINRSNYEEFYLDFLEGNLSGEVLLAFEAFLAENPDLAVEGELLSLEPDGEDYGSFDKLLLKKHVDISLLNEQTADYFLISAAEGLLSENDKRALDRWLEKNPSFKRDAALVAATKSEADLSIVYEEKESLKHKARIVPMWWTGVAAAAAAVLLFIAFNWNTGGVATDNNGIAKADDPKTTAEPAVPGGQVNGSTDKPDASNSVYAKDNSPRTQQAKRKINGASTLPAVDVLEIRRAAIPVNEASLAKADVPAPQPENPQAQPVYYAAVDKMSNPIEPVTKAISNTLDTPVDFRTAKASNKKGGGFYLKLGKLEVSHTSAMR